MIPDIELSHPRMLTTIILDQGMAYVLPHAFSRDQSGQITGVGPSYFEVRQHYYQIGYTLWALVCALAGGFATVYFRERQVKSAERPGADPPATKTREASSRVRAENGT